jgi:hypothetical protein
MPIVIQACTMDQYIGWVENWQSRDEIIERNAKIIHDLYIKAFVAGSIACALSPILGVGVVWLLRWIEEMLK